MLLHLQADIDELDVHKFMKLVQDRKEMSTAVVDDTDTVEAFVALGGKVGSLSQFDWHKMRRFQSSLTHLSQADRSGKVLIEKLRNTIKVNAFVQRTPCLLLVAPVTHPCTTCDCLTDACHMPLL